MHPRSSRGWRLSACAAVLSAALGACGDRDGGDDTPRGGVEPQPPAVREALGEAPARVLRALAQQDFEALAAEVHPVKGVRLSPYAFVDLRRDVVLSGEELRNAARGQGGERRWGDFDGSGEPIEMSLREYFARFVYDVDFLHAESVALGEFIGRGNTRNNALEAYPEGVIVEYHFSGFDPAFAGMDWRSLRLVFEAHAQRWYLVGIIHDEWTI